MGEGLAKQAQTLTDRQIKRALAEVATHRYPERDRVMVLLSVKGGLRAKGNRHGHLGHGDRCRGQCRRRAAPLRTAPARARKAAAPCH